MPEQRLATTAHEAPVTLDTQTTPVVVRSRGEEIRRLARDGGPRMAVQPQLSLARLEVAGYEALARFDGSRRTDHSDPEAWFRQAHAMGLGPDLEAAAVAAALALPGRPAGTTLAVNLSPSVLGSRALAEVLPRDLTGIEIELTEHEAVLDSERVGNELERLRRRGARLAIDDVGAAYSGLRRVMDLKPDSLKLDRHLVSGLAGNSARVALVSAVVDFAEHIGATVCAEGVETVPDLLTLADLDVAFAQGAITGRPSDRFGRTDPAVVVACRESLSRVLSRSGPRATPEVPGSLAPLEDLVSRFADARTHDNLATLVQASSLVLGCDHVSLSRLQDSPAAVQSVAERDWYGDSGVYLLDDYPLTRRCLDRSEIIPVYADPSSDPAEVALLDRLGMSSCLLVPVTSQGRPVGLLEAYLADDVTWSRRQVRFARLLASVLGPVLAGLT